MTGRYYVSENNNGSSYTVCKETENGMTEVATVHYVRNAIIISDALNTDQSEKVKE